MKRSTPMTSAAATHMAAVKELPCGLCGSAAPSHAHHILEGRTPGRKSNDFCTIPLCDDCHVGSRNGIHGQRVMWSVMKKTEIVVLGETIEKLIYKRTYQ